MKILGIIGSSNAGAALIEDGIILAAINEERLNRNKLSDGFPVQSIEEILRITNTKPEDIDQVAFAGYRTFFYMPKKFNGWLEENTSKLKRLKNHLSSASLPFFAINQTTWIAMQKVRFFLTTKKKGQIKIFLKDKYNITCPVKFVDHHFAHACGAFYTFGEKDATVITLDGGGDGYCSRVYKVIDGKFENIGNEITYNSIGNYYAYITKLLGFEAHKHEGKITGLAAYGKPIYLDILKKFINYKDDGSIVNVGKVFMWTAIPKLIKALPKDYKKEDVAASIQALLEEIVVKYCEYWTKKSGIGNLCLVGGVFANVKLNQRIHELDCVDKILIHPGMDDGGLSVGSAFVAYHMNGKISTNNFKDYEIKDVYYGPEYTDKEIEEELKRNNVSYKCFEEIEKEIAKLLAQGYVVARFNGKMEYGPRALGNRSILYHAKDKTVNDWLNKKLVRTEFMPFAPVTLVEHADKCYKNLKGAENTAKFMTITFDCTDFMKKYCPAVVHVDGTARPQIIDKESNPSYYKILNEYHKLTGIPSIINTSFNMHEEPIVCSPYDAIKSFKQGHLDYLAIGNFLVSKDEK